MSESSQSAGQGTSQASAGGESTAAGQGTTVNAGGENSESTAAGQETQAGESATGEESKKAEKPTEKISLLERAKELFTDHTYESDDQVIDALFGEVKEGRKFKDGNLKANQKVLNVFKTNPELGHIIKDVAEGVPPVVAFAKQFDFSKMTPVEGDENYEKYAEAVKDRENKLRESEEFNSLLDTNIKQSEEAVKTFLSENQMDDDTKKQFGVFIDGTIDKLKQGKIDGEVLSLFWNAMNYTKDVEEAEKSGEIKGRNAKIEAVKSDTKKKGDGMPVINSGGDGKETGRKEVSTLISGVIADQENKRKAIFGEEE